MKHARCGSDPTAFSQSDNYRRFEQSLWAATWRFRCILFENNRFCFSKGSQRLDLIFVILGDSQNTKTGLNLIIFGFRNICSRTAAPKRIRKISAESAEIPRYFLECWVLEMIGYSWSARVISNPNHRTHRFGERKLLRSGDILRVDSFKTMEGIA